MFQESIQSVKLESSSYCLLLLPLDEGLWKFLHMTDACKSMHIFFCNISQNCFLRVSRAFLAHTSLMHKTIANCFGGISKEWKKIWCMVWGGGGLDKEQNGGVWKGCWYQREGQVVDGEGGGRVNMVGGWVE